ncbi:hypothetical protein [Sphingobium bisphenolivorans]|uniref:hypothetical protein n=1 Tax=Sphingobium bisphenolivorans TaxID=1335760 RepID=UPI0003B3726D|nr:hypothetical protein [Sphingobium bisphenolivorans]
MTWTGQKFLAAIGLAGALALGGCAYDDGYYGGVSVGSGYYGGGYYDDYYGPGYYGSGYYNPGYYSGWYNGFYYPGSGYYVYDRGGRRHRWNDGQRRYWEGRRNDRDRPAWSGTAPRQSWRERAGNDNDRSRRSWSGRRGSDGSGGYVAPRPNTQAAPSERGRSDMTAPRATWSKERGWGTQSGGDGRSRRGWGRRD